MMRSLVIRRWPTVAAVLLGLLLSSATAAVAQSAPQSRAPLTGRVVGVDGVPIAGAEVALAGKPGRSISDSLGLFQFDVAVNGLYSVSIRYPGHYPLANLERGPGGSEGGTRDYVLEPFSESHAADSALIQQRVDRMLTWATRRNTIAMESSRLGFVVTSDDIAKQSPVWTSDLFNFEQGVRVVGVGATAQVQGSRGNCAPAVILNGLAVPEFRVNEVAPRDIDLMILFRNGVSVPAQYQFVGSGGCGLIVLYTA